MLLSHIDKYMHNCTETMWVTFKYPIRLHKWSERLEIWQADRQHADETLAKFQSNRKTIKRNLAPSEIFRDIVVLKRSLAGYHWPVWKRHYGSVSVCSRINAVNIVLIQILLRLVKWLPTRNTCRIYGYMFIYKIIDEWKFKLSHPIKYIYITTMMNYTLI